MQLLCGELVHGRRSVGGQKKCFKDTLKASLKDFSINVNSLEAPAEEHSMWSNLIFTGADSAKEQRTLAAIKNGNNAGLIPPVSSSFNHPTVVHLVIEASQRRLAKAMRKRKLEPDSLGIFNNEGRRRLEDSTHKKLHNEVGLDGNVCSMQGQAALTVVTDVMKACLVYNHLWQWFPSGNSWTPGGLKAGHPKYQKTWIVA